MHDDLRSATPARPVAAAAKVELTESQTAELERRFEGPLTIRSLALIGIFVLLVFYTMHFARDLMIPVVLAFLLNLLLMPLVRGLGRVGVPTGIAAGLVVLGLIGMLGTLVYMLSGPASEWLSRAPESLQQLQTRLRAFRDAIEALREGMRHFEEMATVEGEEGVVVRGASLAEVFVFGTGAFFAQLATMVVLLFFLLASGDLFRLKLITVLPRLRDKKLAVEITRQMERDISRYLLTITLINIGLGTAAAIAMWVLGMPSPVLWGVSVAVLNYIPFIGIMINLVIVTLVALLTFDTAFEVLLVPATLFTINAIESQLVTPAVLGRRLTLNPVAVFLALILWGWLWGILGMLLAVPILATFKIICDHVPPLQPIGVFLGR